MVRDCRLALDDLRHGRRVRFSRARGRRRPADIVKTAYFARTARFTGA
jgi:hypothetical protein